MLLICCIGLLAVAAGCQGNDDPLPECSLTCFSGKWYLEGFIGNNDSLELPPSGSQVVYVQLADTAHQESRDGLYRYPYPYFGVAPVNTFFGTYNASINGLIEATGPATTYIGGPAELMTYEARFYSALRTANRFEAFEDDRLVIYSDSLAEEMLFFRE